MRWIRVVGLATTLAVVGVAEGHAQAGDFRNFGIQCYMGAFQACASVSVGIVPSLRPGSSRVIVVLANLQGRPGFGHLDPGIALASFTLQNVNISGSPYASLPRISYIGNARGYPYGAVWQPSPNSLSLAIDHAVFAPLFGCDPGPDPPPQMWGPPAYTCTGGWSVWDVDYNLGFGTTISFTETTNLAFRWWGADHGDGVCVSGETCAVVPEPLTITLLATGLAGLGLVRRRKKTDALV